ncbi:hypothetical protein DT426_27525 [Bacillus cereus]|uniref:hypothetical protein n=1 Tax=Bacillus cereus TaxID=1396 RepID=UPI000FD96298|nr:hypothetical protein [Bacillus cereus]AZV69229.1 hypothetical protein DT426_27525 [Bacillus cereus]
MSNIELMKSGYWSIATQKHLKNFTPDSTHLDEFDSLSLSGKAGRFLGVIRGNTSIDNAKKLEKMAQSVGIARRELHTIILPELEKASDGTVEVMWDVLGNIVHIEEYIFSQNKVLEITGQFLENMNPTDIERITLETMDETKRAPLLEHELLNLLSKKGFHEKNIELSTNLQTSFSLIQKLTNMGKEPIYSNEYVWGANHHKIAHAFTSLQLEEKQTLKEVIDLVQNTQGFPLEKLPPIDGNLILLSKKIGMINPTTIISSRGVQKEFGFSANLLESNPYNDDIMDDVKLLLASIRFGENYTPYSTIKHPERFLNYLIEQKKIGPHSANGTDYTLLERRGIVKVTKSEFYQDRYYLELIREDVAKEALKIIANTNFNINIEPDPKEISAILNTSDFKSPEECRMALGKAPEHVAEAMDYLTRVLRDETL